MEQNRITLEKIYFEIKKLEKAIQDKGLAKEPVVSETALMSEKSLAKEWLSPEEDEAWRDL